MENTMKHLQEMIIERVSLMVQDPIIQKIMMGFDKKEEAIDWVYKTAVATLYGMPNE